MCFAFEFSIFLNVFVFLRQRFFPGTIRTSMRSRH